MGNIPTKHSSSRRYPNRHYLDSINGAEEVLERYSNRNPEPNQLRRALAMTKCMCERIEEPLVMTRQLLADLVRQNRINAKAELVGEVITALNDLKPEGIVDDYDSGYNAAIEQAVKTITKLIEIKEQ
jgi:hypothetical protein